MIHLSVLSGKQVSKIKNPKHSSENVRYKDGTESAANVKRKTKRPLENLELYC